MLLLILVVVVRGAWPSKLELEIGFALSEKETIFSIHGLAVLAGNRLRSSNECNRRKMSKVD